MDAAWSPGADPVVGLVDGESAGGSIDDESTGRSTAGVRDEPIESILRDHDATAVRGDPETVLDAAPSLLVAAGDASLSAVARAGPDVPVLPVGDVTGLEAVTREGVPAALEAVLGGNATVQRRSILGIDVDPDGAGNGRDVRERALFDVTLVTDEPARISEFGVSSRGDSIASVRADGVVVATSAGSHGYASALEAPRLSATVDALVVAPIAPFTTRARQWVVPDDGLTISIERNEDDVALFADDRRVETVTPDSRVAITADGTLPTLLVDRE